jgi:hypothetical protein
MSMMANICIYCQDPITLRGKGDHIIPAALGEFLCATHFRRICVACNNKIGQAEQQLLQCGPEALERLGAPVVGRRGRPKRHPKLVGAGGAPSPLTVEQTALGPHSVDVIDPQNVTPVEELTMMDEKNHWHRLRLHPQMKGQALRQRVRRMMLKEIRQCNLFAPAHHYHGYLRLIKEAWPESEHLPPQQVPAGTRQIEANTTFTVTDNYFRAIAKIAFHYYLAFSRCAFGHESEFAGIRDFIIHGGDRGQFFVMANHFGIGVRKGSSHAHLSHYVAYDESGDKVRAFVWLFVKDSPGTVPYEVEWPRRKSLLVLPKPYQAHEYRYEDVIDHKQVAGRVYEKTIPAGHPFLTIL